MKTSRIGGVVVSKKHANFFINDKSGSVGDFLKLQNLVEDRVEKQFGLTLISEIEKVGELYETFSRPSHTLNK